MGDLKIKGRSGGVMPANYSRVEIRFSRKNRERLARMRAEVLEDRGKSVSMSFIVDEIVSRFFDKKDLAEKTCFSLDKG
jgi:hypothetical protein